MLVLVVQEEFFKTEYAGVQMVNRMVKEVVISIVLQEQDQNQHAVLVLQEQFLKMEYASVQMVSHILKEVADHPLHHFIVH